MKRGKYIKRAFITGMLAAALIITAVSGGIHSPEQEVKADAAISQPTITEELSSKRSQFTKQFAMSDGSFTAVTYSMPVHYKKNGAWSEIDTTLTKSGKKKYKTKSTDLSVKVAKKANAKAVVSLKRGKDSLSVAFKGKS